MLILTTMRLLLSQDIDNIMKNFNKVLLAIILNLTLVIHTYSQSITKKNSIYLELGGNAFLYSVNYDRLITLSNHIKIAPRVGFTYRPTGVYSRYDDFIIPLEINTLWAKRKEIKSFVEVGFGLSLFAMKDDYIDINNNYIESVKLARVSILRLGFRYQKPTGGFMYRAGVLIPVTQDEFSTSRVGDDIFFRLYAGFSLGYTF